VEPRPAPDAGKRLKRTVHRWALQDVRHAGRPRRSKSPKAPLSLFGTDSKRERWRTAGQERLLQTKPAMTTACSKIFLLSDKGGAGI
jgi:hypothetical protein